MFFKLWMKIVLWFEKNTRKDGKKRILYINGAETLPPPLTNEEEAEVLEKLSVNEGMKGVLVERNLRLVVYIARKFENTGVEIEDLISIGTIGLIKAINTYNTERNIKLATYASRCIENEILMYIRKIGGQKNEVSLEEPLNTDWDGNELLLSDVLGGEEDSVSKNLELYEDRRTIREAIEKLGDREKIIIELRFGMGTGKEMTQKEVADLLGISQSYISRLEKRILRRIGDDVKSKI